MIDFKDILENDTVKDLLEKAGISDEKKEQIAKEGVKAIKKNYDQNPNQVSSLLSPRENTDDDIKMASIMENDFVQGIMQKFGIDADKADYLKGMLPGIMSKFTNKFSENDNDGGIGGMFDSIKDMFDGDNEDQPANNSTKKKGGFMDIIKGFFSK